MATLSDSHCGRSCETVDGPLFRVRSSRRGWLSRLVQLQDPEHSEQADTASSAEMAPR